MSKFQQKTKALLPTAFLLLFASLQPARATSFDDGVAQYNKRDYNAALELFVQATKEQPGRAAAFYYVASCLYAQGNAEKARVWYDYVIKRFPGSAEAGLAQGIERKLDSAGGAAGQATSAPAATATASGAEGSADPSGLIVVFRGQADRPNVDPSFVEQVKRGLSTFPPGVIRLLNRYGAKVHVTPTTLDSDPDLQNTHARGYEDGMTIKNAPAMFRSPNLVVCQYSFTANDSLVASDDPIGVLRHETGHAIDAFMHYLSQTDDFKHAYFLDVGAMDPDVQTKLHYYTQKAEGGPSEAFAEIVCGLYGGYSINAWRKSQNESILRVFPLYSAKIKQAIDSLK